MDAVDSTRDGVSLEQCVTGTGRVHVISQRDEFFAEARIGGEIFEHGSTVCRER